MDIKEILELIKKKKSKISECRKLYYYKPKETLTIDKYINGKVYTEQKEGEFIYTNWLKVIVNQKIDYSLSKPVKYDIDNMPNEFDVESILEKLTLNASLDSVAWLQLNINDSKKLDWALILDKNIIPIYDKNKKYLMKVIKFWEEKLNDKDILFVQIWDTVKVIELQVKDDKVIKKSTKSHYLEVMKYQDIEEEINPKNFGFIPFIPLYNNKNHESDGGDITILADVYNQISSGFVKNVKKFEELIYILKGYASQDLAEFTELLRKYNTIPIDSDGDLSHLEIKIPVEAREALLKICKENMFIIGRGVDPTFNFSGKDVTNVFIKSFYYPLDVKCSDMEKQIRYFYKQLTTMVNLYYSINASEELIFYRSQIFNISEQIDNCMKSIGIVSLETVLENHPFVKDVEEEKKRIETESKAVIEQNNDSMHDKDTLK